MNPVIMDRSQAEGRLSTTVEAVRPAEPCCPWGAAKTAAAVSGCRSLAPPRLWGNMSQECQGSTHSHVLLCTGLSRGIRQQGIDPFFIPHAKLKSQDGASGTPATAWHPTTFAAALATTTRCSESASARSASTGATVSTTLCQPAGLCRSQEPSRALSAGRSIASATRSASQTARSRPTCIASASGVEERRYQPCPRPERRQASLSAVIRSGCRWVPHLTSPVYCGQRYACPSHSSQMGRSILCMYSLGAALRGAALRVPSGAGARAGRPMPRPLRRARRLSRQGRRPGSARLLQVRSSLFGQGAL